MLPIKKFTNQGIALIVFLHREMWLVGLSPFLQGCDQLLTAKGYPWTPGSQQYAGQRSRSCAAAAACGFRNREEGFFKICIYLFAELVFSCGTGLVTCSIVDLSSLTRIKPESSALKVFLTTEYHGSPKQLLLKVTTAATSSMGPTPGPGLC